MTAAFDHSAMVDVFERLDEYVSSEPSLHGLMSISRALLAQARRIADGDFDIEVLDDAKGPSQLPSREVAQRLISIMASLPPLEATETRSLIAAYAALLGGLAGNITHLIYRDFPDLVPRR
ncbi:MAG: hypothetical protein KF850_01780 [Labilithrix sp.]|nr:hypothetical protein [Labilithrix sp.]